MDKLFTYGTPHGGIEARMFLGWASTFLTRMNIFNSGVFAEQEMRRYLDLLPDKPLQSLDNQFPEDRVFCLIGTNSRDYTVKGAAATMGSFSDGLVKMENAFVYNPDLADSSRKNHAHRAYVYRSHSGHFGLVNSEEGYQCLQRFLFGDIAVSVTLIITDIQIPGMVGAVLEAELKKEITVGCMVETDFSVRGLPMYLNSRNVSEESAIFRSFNDLTKRPLKLLTTFLMSGEKVKPEQPTLGFSLRLTIRMPEIEIDGNRYSDGYEGSAVFSDRLILELDHNADGVFEAKYGWDSKTPNTISLDTGEWEEEEDARKTSIPLHGDIEGILQISARPWNRPLPEGSADPFRLSGGSASLDPSPETGLGIQPETYNLEEPENA